MRSPYEDFAAVSDSGEEAKAHSSAIPYHARENSLPFSYGQINNKTSTPLRRTSGGQYRNPAGGGRAGVLDFDFDLGSSASHPSKTDINFNLSSDRYCGNNYNYNNNGLSAKPTLASGTADSSTIKAQPRLTSPILVRKTLNSRSPTRNGTTNTNTIANTYHYNYGSGNNGIDIGSASSRSRPSDSSFATLNGNINKSSYNGSSYGNSNNNNYGYGGFGAGAGDTIDGPGGGSVVRKTPPRNDFEELLRQRREKVLQEHYLSTSGYSSGLANGNSGLLRHSQPAPPSRSPNTQRKYNYDFEFHLNLDDVPPPPRRAHTMERSSLQQYRTRDIPVAHEAANTSSYVERNYHTISSSNASREAAGVYPSQQQQQQQQQQYQQQQQSLDMPLYSTVERRTVQSVQQQQQQQRQLPLPPHQPQQQQRQQQQQQSRPEDASYGNGNASGYGFNEYGNNRGSLGAAVVARSRNDLSSSPIYATTTKQVATSTTYRNNNTLIEPELSTTDHPTPLSLPLSAAANTNTAGKISPSSAHGARPETPAFPVTPRTPFGGYNGQNSPVGYAHSPLPQRPDLANGRSTVDLNNYSSETIYRSSCRPRLGSNMSMVNSEPQEVAAHLVKFAKDSSKFWYKPNLSRDEVVALLLNAEPGTFIVRNSTTYKDNYGLVVRVSQPPPNSELTGQPDDLVRHFLIEPTTRGVRLKSCANEPVFTSLSALIYEHSINKLALPCLLRIPEHDLLPPRVEPTTAQRQLLTQGAACNVLWLYSSETESLTGEEAIRKAIRQLYAQQPLPTPTEVHFKVTQHGITLTDNKRKKFFRKHYAADHISYCAIDPDHRLWTMQQQTDESGKNTVLVGTTKKTIFAFVARHSAKSKDNQCHVFCDLDLHQPASAIVSFANKTLPTEKQRNFVL